MGWFSIAYTAHVSETRFQRIISFLRSRRSRQFRHTTPVPSFGNLDAPLLVVGLAPGLKGANQTGRPFTGDYAGIILYNALLKFEITQAHPLPHV